MNQISKHEVLLLDDEIVWGGYLSKLIGDNYTIKHFNNVNCSIKEIRTNPNIDIVITEIAFDNNKSEQQTIGGLSLIELIKNLRPDLPIIVHTGFNLESLKNVKDIGADMILSKSDFLGNRLKNAIEKLIHKSTEVTYKITEETEEDKVVKRFKMAISESLEQYAIVKEKTLSIPEEGNFEVIKPLIGFKRDIEKQISKFGYNKNVFLMMKFRDDNKELSDFIIENLAKHDLVGVRADQNLWNITKNVYNPLAVLYCCKYGIALFDEPEDHQAYSPNVAYELGVMHYQNKNCLILKHDSLPAIPFDLIKDIYFNYSKDLHLKKIITEWIIQISND